MVRCYSPSRPPHFRWFCSRSTLESPVQKERVENTSSLGQGQGSDCNSFKDTFLPPTGNHFLSVLLESGFVGEERMTPLGEAPRHLSARGSLGLCSPHPSQTFHSKPFISTLVFHQTMKLVGDVKLSRKHQGGDTVLTVRASWNC